MRYDRVIFSGTRLDLTEADAERVRAVVLHYHGRANYLGVGCCPTGVDALVRQLLGGDVRVFEADWTRLGKAAGPERNGRMVAWASGAPRPLLVAFPDARDDQRKSGTGDCYRQAVAAGVDAVTKPVGGGR